MSWKPVRPKDGHAGFTLIELVVVIGAVALVMAILMLGVRRASDAFSLRRAATVVTSELRRAQASAVSGAVDYTVEFQVTSPYQVTVYRQTTAVRAVSGQEWPSSVTIRSDPESTVPFCTTPGSVTNKCVTFRPLGFANAGGVVQLRSRTGVTVNVAVTAATGRVSVQP